MSNLKDRAPTTFKHGTAVVPTAFAQLSVTTASSSRHPLTASFGVCGLILSTGVDSFVEKLAPRRTLLLPVP